MKVLLSLLFCLLSATGSWAVGIYPARVDIDVHSGIQTKTIFHVVNKSESQKNATLTPTDLSADPNFVLVFSPAKAGTPASWLLPQTEAFVVPPQSDVEHTFRINVPSGTQPGEYYVGLLLDPDESRVVSGQNYNVTLKTRVAAIVRIAVGGSGQLPKSATVSEPNVVIEKDQPIKVDVNFQNTSATHLVPQGQCRILGEGGRVYDSFILQAAGMSTKGSAFVFPKGARKFSGKIQRRLPLGKYTAEFSFDYGNGWRKATVKKEFEITQETATSQENLLMLEVDKELIEEVIPRGGLRIFKVTVNNVDIDPMTIVVTKTLIADVSPEKIVIPPGGKQDFRIIVRMPKEGDASLLEQSGKITFTPQNGEPISVDVRIKLLAEKSNE